MRRTWRSTWIGVGLMAALGAGCTAQEGGGAAATAPVSSPRAAWRKDMNYTKPSEQDLKQKLDPLQFEVTQQCGTEPPFQNAFWNEKRPGLYVDVVSGEPLFSSLDKFDSGTGWPSFTRPVAGTGIKEVKDTTHGMTRVEVRSPLADSHLGHVFPDGPQPTGMRYCINSASLRFVPVEEMEAQGYGEYLEPFVQAGLVQRTRERAVLAGGCFWGMEELLRRIPGVLETNVGYTGGEVPQATYQVVKTGRTGHAEAVEIVFDPTKLSYEDLLEKWFFKMHDPTTADRQGNDVGTQYRSAIFYTSEAQKQAAERVKARVDASGKWKRPLVTHIVPAGPFWQAEEYHQDYLQKNPDGYTCHFMRD